MPKNPGRPKKLEKENRLHISIPQSLTEKLDQLQVDTHASSLTEVIKKALVLYSAALEEHKAGGHTFFHREGEATPRQLALFI